MLLFGNPNGGSNLFGNLLTSFTDKKDIMPTNGCTKPFVGINLIKNRIALP